MTAEQRSATMKAARETFCSKCGIHPRAFPGSSNGWCRECNADYEALRREKLVERAEAKGRQEGIDAMRALVVALWQQWPGSYFSGAEVAAKVQTMEGPRFTSSPESSSSPGAVR